MLSYSHESLCLVHCFCKNLFSSYNFSKIVSAIHSVQGGDHRSFSACNCSTRQSDGFVEENDDNLVCVYRIVNKLTYCWD